MFGKKEEKADCPLWRAPCKEHGCRWWKHIMGNDPNTGQPLDRYDCAIAWLPTLMIEVAMQARQTGASTDKVATEVRKFHDGMAQQNANIQRQLESKGEV